MREQTVNYEILWQSECGSRDRQDCLASILNTNCLFIHPCLQHHLFLPAFHEPSSLCHSFSLFFFIPQNSFTCCSRRSLLTLFASLLLFRYSSSPSPLSLSQPLSIYFFQFTLTFFFLSNCSVAFSL